MNASAPLLTLNELIRLSGIAVEEVLVFRHRPNEPQLNRVFDWLVAERLDLFDCYQSNHGSNTESALKRARYLASFIRHTPGTALFVGLYEVASSRRLSVDECMNRPCHRELMSLGMTGIKATEGRDSVLEFEMPLTGWHANWRGRLIIRWPGLERSWYRWMDRNEFAIESIARESLFSPAMPSWDELTLAWNELALLPSSWRAALGQWRAFTSSSINMTESNMWGQPMAAKTSCSAGMNMLARGMVGTSSCVNATRKAFAFRYSSACLLTCRMPT